MADLIDRQAVRLIESDANAYHEEWNDDYEKGFTDALNKVIALPSAQQEIIRCKDCKHYIAHDKRCGYWNHGVSLDWWDEWCSHGERRADDGE